MIPLEIPLAAAPEVAKAKQVIRIRPLPYLMLSQTIDSGELLKAGPLAPTPDARPLSEETTAALERLLAAKEPRKFGDKAVVWFSPRDGGELEDLLADSFEEQKWENGLSIIGSYMQTRRSADEQSRARFYKGQCLYFLGRYEEAFMEFIFAQDASYTQVQPWLDDIISILAAQT
jgi:hypothetical protein